MLKVVFHFSQKDAMILEDHSGRVALGGVMKAITANLVSGVILAVKGSIDEFGEFVVSRPIHNFVQIII